MPLRLGNIRQPKWEELSRPTQVVLTIVSVILFVTIVYGMRESFRNEIRRQQETRLWLCSAEPKMSQQIGASYSAGWTVCGETSADLAGEISVYVMWSRSAGEYVRSHPAWTSINAASGLIGFTSEPSSPFNTDAGSYRVALVLGRIPVKTIEIEVKP